jgi:hypothetical protein
MKMKKIFILNISSLWKEKILNTIKGSLSGKLLHTHHMFLIFVCMLIG